MTAPAFGVYVHWPYCAQKCPYCDFNSHVRDRTDEARWANAIVRELGAIAELQGASRPRVDSVFFGGGTPSLMSGPAVARVLDGIAGLWPVAADAEVTLEANPNSVEQERFAAYRAAGVNRISIGVQALNEADLKALGRLHGAEEAMTAIRLATRLFPRASFDLIYARPNQSRRDWEDELRRALAFGTEHLSLYQLTIEPGTAFATWERQGKLTVPGEDIAADLFETTQEMCAAAGLPAYEISNHAREGAECRHNLLYWRYGDYAGAGPGAHGRLSLTEGRVATQAERLPERWLNEVETHGHALTQSAVAHGEAAREHLLMNLRLSEGLDLARYRARWGFAPDAARMAALAGMGLIAVNGGRIAATSKGRLVLNALIAELSAAPEPVS